MINLAHHAQVLLPVIKDVAVPLVLPIVGWLLDRYVQRGATVPQVQVIVVNHVPESLPSCAAVATDTKNPDEITATITADQ
jgi:hypothetical protein